MPQTRGFFLRCERIKTHAIDYDIEKGIGNFLHHTCNKMSSNGLKYIKSWAKMRMKKILELISCDIYLFCVRIKV